MWPLRMVDVGVPLWAKFLTHPRILTCGPCHDTVNPKMLARQTCTRHAALCPKHFGVGTPPLGWLQYRCPMAEKGSEYAKTRRSQGLASLSHSSFRGEAARSSTCSCRYVCVCVCDLCLVLCMCMHVCMRVRACVCAWACSPCAFSVPSLCLFCAFSVPSLCLPLCLPCAFSVPSLCLPCAVSVSSLCLLCAFSVPSLCLPCVFSVPSLCLCLSVCVCMFQKQQAEGPAACLVALQPDVIRAKVSLLVFAPPS